MSGREPGAPARHVVLDELWPERRILGPIKRRLSRKARRAVRHSEVAAIATDRRRTIYRNQNGRQGAKGAGLDGLTPRQRRRIRHKENAGRRS